MNALETPRRIAKLIVAGRQGRLDARILEMLPYGGDTDIIEADSIAMLECALCANPGVALVVLDFSLVKDVGLSALGDLRARHPSVAIAIISAADLARIHVERSDDGAIVRNVERLTVQQRRVLMCLSNGLTNKTIAQHLCVTEATVKAHITVILRKLGLECRTQAALLAQRTFGHAPRALAHETGSREVIPTRGCSIAPVEYENAKSNGASLRAGKARAERRHYARPERKAR